MCDGKLTKQGTLGPLPPGFGKPESFLEAGRRVREKAAQPARPTSLEVVQRPHLEGFSTGFCGLSIELTVQEPSIASMPVWVALWGLSTGVRYVEGSPMGCGVTEARLGLWGPWTAAGLHFISLSFVLQALMSVKCRCHNYGKKSGYLSKGASTLTNPPFWANIVSERGATTSLTGDLALFQEKKTLSSEYRSKLGKQISPFERMPLRPWG